MLGSNVCYGLSHTHTQWEAGEGGYELSTTKIINKRLHTGMNTKELYFPVDRMSICVTYREETKAP